VIHQFDPHMAPDSEFTPGALELLVSGNEGRMLDPRRTPVRILGIDFACGLFRCEILDFEDRGAQWDLPFEKVVNFQFARGSRRAGASTLRGYRAAIARFDRPLEIPRDDAARPRTLKRLNQLKREATAWLESRSQWVAAGGALDAGPLAGDPRLWRDLRAWLAARRLWTIEREFSRVYVSNPHSGEIVKGHRIVLAELGLAPFAGTIVRRPLTFEGRWRRKARAEHILSRMAFVQAAFARAGKRELRLFRGIAGKGGMRRDRRTGFVSASFSREVAESILGPPGRRRVGRIEGQRVPLRRLFMSYLETEAMNLRFREAEAVLIVEPEGGAF